MQQRIADHARVYNLWFLFFANFSLPVSIFCDFFPLQTSAYLYPFCLVSFLGKLWLNCVHFLWFLSFANFGLNVFTFSGFFPSQTYAYLCPFSAVSFLSKLQLTSVHFLSLLLDDCPNSRSEETDGFLLLSFLFAWQSGNQRNHIS